ncbi:hypothetical protein ABPG72_001050 [Tetrahymena utriculariae]
MNKQIIALFMIATFAIAQAPGARIHLTTGFMNRAKDWALPTLIPGGKLDLNAPDTDVSGFHLSNMYGELRIPPETISFSITENSFELSINDMHVSFHFDAKLNKFIKGSASPTGTFSTDVTVSFGINGAGQLQIASFGIHNFRIGHTNVDLPAFVKSIINFFIDLLSRIVQSKLNEMAPTIQNEINIMLTRSPTEAGFGNLPIGLDLTFSNAIQLTSGQMIVALNLFAYNNQKPKARPPFENPTPFPAGPAAQDFTFFLSEYTLNSMSFAAFDTGMMAKDFGIDILQNLSSVEQLNGMLGGIEDVLKSATVTVKVHAANYPQFNIAGGVFSLASDLVAELVATYTDKTIPILGLNIATNFGVSASVVNNSFLGFHIDHAQLTKFDVTLSTFKTIDLEQVATLINNVLAYFLPEINEKFCNGQIPMNGANFVLTGAVLELVDHHIMVQASPYFGNFSR